jgi:UDP-glucose 4-epimerase
MQILITGIAGFVGTNLARRFLEQGYVVYGLDNFCRGQRANLQAFDGHDRFNLYEVDLHDLEAYRNVVGRIFQSASIDEVWHLAANSDIPAGIADPNVDLRDTYLTTHNTLILMREFGIARLAFASSSAIYGDHGETAIIEDIGPLLPISNYGAMKLASEASISAAAESYLKQAYIFRFPNVIGTPATHGVILDFVRKLKTSPDDLPVLGDGSQQKSYLHVEDLIDAMLFVRDHANDKLSYFNVGPVDDGVSVRTIAETVRDQLAPDATISYGTEGRGWVGDVPRFYYDTSKLNRLGWKPTMDSRSAVELAVSEIIKQESLA